MLEYATWTSEFFSGRIETKTPKSSTISDAQSAVIQALSPLSNLIKLNTTR